MKRSLLLFFIPLFLSYPISAAADWMENFDSYATGSGLHGQGGWKGWDNSPAWDAIITNVQSLSAPNSVEIVGSSDMVHEFTEATSGQWIFTAWQFIPGNFSGQSYFILLNTYNDGGPYNWSTQIRFDSAGFVESEFEGNQLPLIRDRWVELRVAIDLDTDMQTFYYDGQMLTQKSWTEGLSGEGALNVGAVDLFANGATPVYYDDLSLVEEQPTAIETTSWGQVKQLFR